MKKRFNLKPVKKYKQPSYPIVDDSGKVLFTPNESSKLGDIAKEISKPIAGIAFTVIASQSVQANQLRKPETYITQVDENDTDEDTLPEESQNKEKKPIIKKFTEKQITSLIEELNFQKDDNTPKFVEGYSKGPIYSTNVTEDQARRILEKFFRKNGIVFEYNTNFKREDIEFEIDGYNKDKKVGWEFGYKNEKDLSQDEITTLQNLTRKDKEHILLIDAQQFKGLPSGKEAISRLQNTAEEFLKTLYKKGAVQPQRLEGEDLENCIRNLSSKEDKVSSKAYLLLKKSGMAIISRLEKEKQTENIKKLLKEIKVDFQKDVENFYKNLDSDDPAVREEATTKLINMDEDAIPYVKKLAQLAKERKSEEVKSRLEMILKEIE